MKFSKIHLEIVKDKNIEYNSKIIKNALDVVEFINSIERYDLKANEFITVICLNTKNNIVAYNDIGQGGLNSANIDFKEIFKTVLCANCGKFILVHNHPSGDCTPSPEDYKITDRLKKASEIMQIQFLDHIIIADEDFESCYLGGE